MSTQEYLQRLEAVFVRLGRPVKTSLWDIVEGWKHFVERCERGNDDIRDEFRFDLQYRGLLEQILKAPELQDQPELTYLKEAVEAIDARVRPLRLPALPDWTDEQWWVRRLRYGGREYVGSVRGFG